MFCVRSKGRKRTHRQQRRPPPPPGVPCVRVTATLTEDDQLRVVFAVSRQVLGRGHGADVDAAVAPRRLRDVQVGVWETETLSETEPLRAEGQGPRIAEASSWFGKHHEAK